MKIVIDEVNEDAFEVLNHDMDTYVEEFSYDYKHDEESPEDYTVRIVIVLRNTRPDDGR